MSVQCAASASFTPPVIQAGFAAAAALDESEVSAGFGEQVAAVEAAAGVHHEHRGGDGDGRRPTSTTAATRARIHVSDRLHRRHARCGPPR
ncbi:hypothetical protein [Streptomyces coeruleorubidus]|uniref:Uncharacterized protein n=1 Tax=Streptomyces coeruleorubidus TaxID=116188 RepID=A0ABZ0KRY4_STRC4|nr:hypothetical protein [Streptomyces coeruleorubidus]WOT40581.1 hypothetical protein R5U08_41515 [Streptomyces coeruleorubidus]